MNRRTWLSLAAALLLLLTLAGLDGAASARAPDGLNAPSRDSPAPAPATTQPETDKAPPAGDGLEQLPLGKQAVSYSTLVMAGLVDPSKLTIPQLPSSPAAP